MLGFLKNNLKESEDNFPLGSWWLEEFARLYFNDLSIVDKENSVCSVTDELDGVIEVKSVWERIGWFKRPLNPKL